MRLVKQSTAYNAMVFMTDATGHIDGATGLTLTITASKDGAAFGSISPTVTERGSGWYSLALTTTHTDTIGDLALHVTGTGADPSDLLLQVRANVLGDTLPASVAGNVGGNVVGSVGSVVGAVGSIGAGGISAGSFAAGAIDNAAIAANAIAAAEIANDAITSAKIATGAIDADALAADAVDKIHDDTIGDGTLTFRQAARIEVAALAGELSGAATTTVTIRNVSDSADVIVATVDASGNRTATTVTP